MCVSECWYGECVIYGEAESDSSGAAVAAVLCLWHRVLASTLVAELGHWHPVLVEGHGVEADAAANPADRLRAARILARKGGLPVCTVDDSVGGSAAVSSTL